MTAATDVVDVCAALADASRWRILELVGEQARSASELAELVPISRQAIARHLGVLTAAGLVSSEQVGKQLRFRALGGRLSELARTLDAVGRGWDQRLGRLQALAEQRAAERS